MFCSGVLCFVFLLFQRDVRELMFSHFGSLTIAKPSHNSAAATARRSTEHRSPRDDAATQPGSPAVDPSPLLGAHDPATAGQPGVAAGGPYKFREEVHREITDAEELEPLRQQEVATSPPPASPAPDTGQSPVRTWGVR